MSRSKQAELPEEGLSNKEYLLFGLLFLAIPIVCVIVSSVLYYVWKKDQPKRANQINRLGFIVFGIHILLPCLLGFVLSKLGG